MQDAQHTTSIRQVTSRRTRFALRVASLILVMPAVPVGASDAAPVDREMSVLIYPSAVVMSDTIRLKDIGQIEGATGSSEGEWAIVTGLRSGQSYVVEIDTIQKVLQRRGANLGLWVFRGHSRCRVERVDSPTHDESADESPVVRISGTPAVEDSPHSASSPAGVESNADSEFPREVDPNSLDAELRRHIASRLASLGGRPVIRFNASSQRYLKLTKPTYQFRVTDDNQRLLGMVPLQVTILEGDLVRQTTQILAEVILEKQVVVARHLMNRGHVITAQDLDLRAFPFKDLSEVQFTDTRPLIGQRARKLIDAGSQIAPRDIEPVPLVQRNDLVTVWVRRGNLVIKSTAKAMDSAGYGEPVELKNAQTREYFTGIVTGVRTVELPAPKPGSALALADTRNKREQQ